MYVKKISHIAEIRVSSEYKLSTIKTETIILTRIFASSIFIESHLTTKYACQFENGFNMYRHKHTQRYNASGISLISNR